MPRLRRRAEGRAAWHGPPLSARDRRCTRRGPSERLRRARAERDFLKLVRPHWTDVLGKAPCAHPCGLYLSRMARRSIDCRIRVDGMPARSETILTEAGPNALVLSTTLRDRGIWIDST